MRRITTTLVLALIAAAATAGQIDASNLVLTTFKQGSFTVRLDGQMYHANDRIELEGITPGRHYMRIDRKRQSQHSYGGQGRILFSGYIDIPAGSIVRAMVNHNRRLIIEVDPLFAACQMSCPPNACTCSAVIGQGYGNPYTQVACETDTWNTGYNNGSVYSSGTNYGSGYQSTACGNTYGSYGQYNTNWAPVMTQQGFSEFRRSLHGVNFETAKLTAIQNQLQHVRFTAAQTRTLISLFSFDSSRLELAKMVYPTVVDPNRYYLVAEAFTFNSTRQELYHFMQN
jgi:hypothetical protein